jgi:LacI family transcriptional regulator
MLTGAARASIVGCGIEALSVGPPAMRKVTVQAKKRPTILDVAKLSRTSVGTVSRVLNENSAVRTDTQRRVRSAVDRLGYRPNAIARSMRTKSTHAIGFIVPDICNPIFATIMRAAEEILIESGYFMMLANTDLNPAREVEIIEVFAQRRIDALIMAVSTENNPSLIKATSNLETPVVMLNRELSNKFDAVLIDDFNGVRQATEYLIQLGHTRIGLITAGEEINPGRQRTAGYRAAYSNSERPVDESLIRAGVFETDGYRETFALLDSKKPPTAIISGNQVLVGVLRALRQKKQRIPDDISLISCDDTYLAELMVPALTVLDRSLVETGRMAARLVLQHLQSESPREPQRITLPTQLIRRDSCRSPKN